MNAPLTTIVSSAADDPAHRALQEAMTRRGNGYGDVDRLADGTDWESIKSKLEAQVRVMPEFDNRPVPTGEIQVVVKPHETIPGNVKVLVKFPGNNLEPKGLLTEVNGFQSANDNSYTIGVSTQIDCTFDCQMCGAARKYKGGAKANLAAEQMLFLEHLTLKYAQESGLNIDEKTPIRITHTGDGDPGANQSEVSMAALHQKAVHPNIDYVMVSTVGVPKSIIKFAETANQLKSLGITLVPQISPHGTTYEERHEAAQSPKGVSARDLIDAGREFYKKTGIPARINWVARGENEYALGNPAHPNITDASADRLLDMIGDMPEAFFVTVVPVNPMDRDDAPLWARPVPVRDGPAGEEDKEREARRQLRNLDNAHDFAKVLSEKAQQRGAELVAYVHLDGGIANAGGCGQAGQNGKIGHSARVSTQILTTRGSGSGFHHDSAVRYG